uniref:Uncharacterized protein n=1 Tax=Zea mays TaxID=4577 RepID=B4G285_MAIZE|nr:unknown [Zea mays]
MQLQFKFSGKLLFVSAQ